MAITNPQLGIILEGRFLNHNPESFRENTPLSNSSDVTQNSKTFSIMGSRPKQFTFTVSLDNTYDVKAGTSWGTGVIGTTTWLGVSQKAYLENIIGGLGPSMPLTLVVPYGMTYSVIPVGQIDTVPHNPSNPNASGMEFRVSLSFEATS